MAQRQLNGCCRHCNVAWGPNIWEFCPECGRNYDGAIDPNKLTAEESVEVVRIIDLIKHAFRDVNLEDGTSIHEADLEGTYSDRERVAARKKDTEVNWLDVPDWKIERFSSALSFLDLKGWRFYIPAYMIWTLRFLETSNSITSDFVVWGFEPTSEELHLKRFATLSLEQSQAVYSFVKFFCDYSDDPSPRRAMQNYWFEFAPTET